MLLDQPLVRAKIISRVNRFTVAVEAEGALTLAHLANSGRVRELLVANDDADPLFGSALREAAAAGVRLLAYRCHVSPATVELAEEIPVLLPPAGSGSG